MKLLASLLVLLLLVGGVFARAPSWVSSGTSINYTVGSATYTFTVTEVSSSQIKIDLKTSSSSSTSRLIDNATADSGQFWFDPTLLTSASAGRSIGGYSVISTSQESYAGKSFQTATLQIILGGVTTTKVFDIESGLLLDQRTSASGSSPVLIRNYFVPAWAPPPPNVTTPAPSSTPPTPTTPSSQPTTPTPSSTNSTSSPSTPTSNSTPSVTPPLSPDPIVKPSSQSSSTCPCPESLFFVLLGFLAVGKKVEKI